MAGLLVRFLRHGLGQGLQRAAAALPALPSSVPGEGKSAQEEPVPTSETLWQRLRRLIRA